MRDYLNCSWHKFRVMPIFAFWLFPYFLIVSTADMNHFYFRNFFPSLTSTMMVNWTAPSSSSISRGTSSSSGSSSPPSTKTTTVSAKKMKKTYDNFCLIAIFDSNTLFGWRRLWILKLTLKQVWSLTRLWKLRRNDLTVATQGSPRNVVVRSSLSPRLPQQFSAE
jgi:hypothetical protein